MVGVSMETKNISRAVIKRLPRYYRYLGELLENNVERISSSALSERMSVTASQIRQDLNHFGGFGQQGYGYNVEYLYTEIGKILGLNDKHSLIIVGAGNLGQALAKSSDFSKNGFELKGIFDIDMDLIGTTISGVEISHMDEMFDFVHDNNIEMAALTIPREHAIKVAHKLVDAGVKGIWNFALTDLDLPKHVKVENVHLSESLMRLSYNVTHTSDM